MTRNKFGMRVDRGILAARGVCLAAAIVAAICLVGTLNAAAESDSVVPQAPQVIVKRSLSTRPALHVAGG